MVRLVVAARIAPFLTTSAPTGTSLRFAASRARSRAFRTYCSSAAKPCVAAPSACAARSLSAGKRRLFRFPERQLALRITIHDDMIALAELALQHGKRQWVLEQTL